MGTTTSLVTVSDFLRIPNPPSGQYELHHGEVVLIPPPKAGHERIQERLRDILKRIIGGHGVVRVEMAFQPTPEFEIWRADIGVISAERDKRTPDDAYLEGAPDLVVEVLSTGNTVDEINDKMRTCLDHGCSSFWVVDGKRKEVSVTEWTRPGNSLITRHYKDSDQIDNEVFNISLAAKDIFE